MLQQLLSLCTTDLAIDLGTANTLISVPGEGVLLDEPSVVAVQRDSQRILSDGCAVGNLARQMLGRTPEGISVVHPLAAGVVADYVLCEAMLRYFLRKVQRNRFGLKPRALLSVPGAITPVERRALYNSAQRAGLRQVFLLPEATAAALGAGLPVAEPVASMICDIGGGTTEVAILSLGDTVASRSLRIAGDAMDQAVVDYLRKHYSLRIGTQAAEELKLEVGSAYPLDDELVAEVRGIDTVTGLPRKATITSEEIREALADPLDRIVEAIHATLDQCSPELASDLVDHGLVLAGGGSLLAGIEHFITDRTGLPARIAGNPQQAVAHGNAICLEHLDQWIGRLPSSDDDD